MFTAIAALGVLVTTPSIGVTPAQSPAELYPLPLYPGGISPKAALVRDLDGDGRVEVVVPYAWWDGVRGVKIMRGQPDGSLGEPATYRTDAWPDFIESADLDHDGLLDLVACCRKVNATSSIAVLLGRGAGTFHQAVEFDTDVNPTALALGDVNEDGNVDLLLNDEWGWNSHGERLLLGQGDGTFAAPIVMTGTDQLRSMRLADINADGHLDLVAIVWVPQPTFLDWELQSQLGAGDGTFGSPMHTPVAAQSIYLAMHDFDGDGRSDALVSSPYPGVAALGLVQSFPALPNGAFGAPTTLWSGYYAGKAAIADIDGDGLVDVAIPHPPQPPDGGGVAIARGLGGFAFAPTQEVRTGTRVLACYCGDVDGDGDTDFVTLSEQVRDTVGVVRASAPGEFNLGLAPIALPTPSASITSGDIDGDGRIDLATVSGARHIALRRNLGQGHFANARTLTAATRLERIALHDFNGDGRADVVAVGPGWWAYDAPGTLSVWRSTSQGFAARDDYDVGVGYSEITVADFDDDSHDDLAVTSGPDVRILHANPDGTFDPAAIVALAPYAGGGTKLFAGDFDGDGHIDLASSPVHEVVIAYGLGAGAFAAPITLPFHGGDGKDWIAGAGDLDRDGIDDLVVGIFCQDAPIDQTALLFGRKDKTFDHRRLNTGYEFTEVFISDLDADGKADLAGLEYDALVVLTGDGRRGFEPQLSYAIGYGAQPTMADFNGDGRLDFAFTFAQENVLSVMLHR